MLLALLTACSGQNGEGGPASQPPGPPSATPTSLTVTEPTPAAELGLLLDDSGRPYDAPVDAGVTVQTRPLASLDIAGGQLRVMDGSALAVFPGEGAPGEGGMEVDFAGSEQLQVDIVWEPQQTREAVLGVRVRVPDSQPVARWARFRYAYGTDGGMGGITSEAVVRRATASGFEAWKPPTIDDSEEVYLLDLDGRPGEDSLLFSNGYGDGGFPMSEGRDATGRLVALLIWHPRYPWRLAVPEGAPPPDVLERELELEECIAGRRPITVYDETKICT